MGALSASNSPSALSAQALWLDKSGLRFCITQPTVPFFEHQPDHFDHPDHLNPEKQLANFAKHCQQFVDIEGPITSFRWANNQKGGRFKQNACLAGFGQVSRVSICNIPKKMIQRDNLCSLQNKLSRTINRKTL